jgi:hypothetical protein
MKNYANNDTEVIHDPALIRDIAGDPNFDRDFDQPVSSRNTSSLQRMSWVFSVNGKRFPTMCPRTDAQRAAAQDELWARLNAITQEIKSGPDELEPLAQWVRGTWAEDRIGPLVQQSVGRLFVSDFTSTEELRKAMGGKRAESVLQKLMGQLLTGMAANCFTEAQKEEVIQILSTVREFMFPESHAHSFASIAYSTAYTRFHYPAAYLAAILNAQPMGFYSPETLANDAKRHGVKILPIDVQKSDWFCTLEKLSEGDTEKYSDPFVVRIGLKYIKKLRKLTGDAIAEERLLNGPFESEYDLCRRVPSVKKAEPLLLAKAGALNWTGEKHHRRAALWHAERAGQRAGPLFENVPDKYELEPFVPLLPMTNEERLVADFDSTGLSLDLIRWHTNVT